MPNDVERALAHWSALRGGAVEPLGAGLINETFLVTGADGSRAVLQRVNPIFEPRVHENILVVTEHLARRGMVTPRLVPTDEGAPYLDLEHRGIWRVSTFIEGATFDRAVDVAQIEAAAALVGRFHRALAELGQELVVTRLGVHDTPRHLAVLREALDEHRDHRLAGEVGPLGDEILRRADALTPLPRLEPFPCHGDLKLNNVRFAGVEPPDRNVARCLVDLDTLGPMSIAHEMGDAWRSWCNLAGEDDAEARFDLAIFEASLRGWTQGLGRPLSLEERQALLLGVEWISLELAARFAADALRERYFGFDPRRFPARGEHNLRRARGQLSLHRAVVATRSARERLLDL